jgi:hypothetical protein
MKVFLTKKINSLFLPLNFPKFSPAFQHLLSDLMMVSILLRSEKRKRKRPSEVNNPIQSGSLAKPKRVGVDAHY